jgi:small-conductance mechanosensitive channel
MPADTPQWDWLNDMPPELAHAIVLLIAGLAGWVVAFVGDRVARRWLSTHATVYSVLQALCKPAYRVLPLLAMLFMAPLAPDLRVYTWLYRALSVLATLGLTWAAMRLVDALARWVAFRHPVDAADNLAARRIQTQAGVLARALNVVVLVIGVAVVLTAFPQARQLGASVLASAGVAGLVVGFAARPLFANLIAGIQIALTQPIRIDDVVVVEKQNGRIEEIGASYVVVKLWDERRLVVPLNYFLEHPFENWTRTSAALLGNAALWLDYATPVEPLRTYVRRACEASPLWDRRVCELQVNDANDKAIQLRILASATDSSRSGDLCTQLREGLIAYVVENYPKALPRVRQEATRAPEVVALQAPVAQ